MVKCSNFFLYAKSVWFCSPVFVFNNFGFQEQFGVVGDPATTMRDPTFYLWHAHVDDVFNLYKAKLSPYGPDKV